MPTLVANFAYCACLPTIFFFRRCIRDALASLVSDVNLTHEADPVNCEPGLESRNCLATKERKKHAPTRKAADAVQSRNCLATEERKKDAPAPSSLCIGDAGLRLVKDSSGKPADPVQSRNLLAAEERKKDAPAPSSLCIGDARLCHGGLYLVEDSSSKVEHDHVGTVQRLCSNAHNAIPTHMADTGLHRTCPPAHVRKQDAPLPGGFRIGDAVLSLLDFETVERGRVERGQVGRVQGHCVNVSLADAADRVNCDFPGLPNVDYIAAHLRKPDEPLPGGFRIGDTVVCLLDLVESNGKVERGDVGTVRCHCNDPISTGATDRVNCDFPDIRDVNFLTTLLCKQDVPLPGGFCIGDAVVCLKYLENCEGWVEHGSVGIVRCHCSVPTLADAAKRVNCEFPGLRNVNVLVTGLLKETSAAPSYGLSRLSAWLHEEEWNLLENLLDTNSALLGQGRDARSWRPYHRLKLVCAWQVRQSDRHALYAKHVELVRKQMALLRRAGLAAGRLPGLPVKTANAASRLCTLQADVSEALLLHGTSKEKLMGILTNGLDERYGGTSSGTAFGEGVYLAEDVGKTDQYAREDKKYDLSLELHKLVFGKTYRHPGNIHYALVCKAILGLPARTQEYGSFARAMDTGKALFPVSSRELAPVPGSKEHINYHSLLVECAGTRQYREVVMFHGDRILVEFVLAYQRI